MNADPPVHPETGHEPATPAKEMVASRYEIAEVIGEGGMGTIHRARDVTFGRDVAIKLLKPDVVADSPASNRFLFESKITGQLQHPGIPPAYELGSLPDGRLFLAMKLVLGETLRSQLKARTNPAENLSRFVAVFEQICNAVGFAHMHGIIHRDLKPANVMVGAHGEVQVMDWGLAKVLGGEDAQHAGAASSLPEKSERREGFDETITYRAELETPQRGDSATKAGAILGTPSYMPPEQASGDIQGLDARSDVFGLGAILCEIFIGRPPYRGLTVKEICNQAIQGRMTEALDLMDQCGAEPALISLCKQCLSFKKEDRPENGLAVASAVASIREAADSRARQAEIARERAVVLATEQEKRRRTLQTSATTVVCVLLVGMAISLWQMNRANWERDAKGRALEAEQIAKTAAEKRLTQIEKGTALLAGLIRGINPRGEELGGEPIYVQLRKRAESAADELEAEQVADPVAVARLQTMLGDTLLELGNASKAVVLFEKARDTQEQLLGFEHVDTLATLDNLVLGYLAIGKEPEAFRVCKEVLETRMKLQGANHPQTLLTQNNLALLYLRTGQHKEAVERFETIREEYVRQHGEYSTDTFTMLTNLAHAYLANGQPEVAVQLCEDVRDAQEKSLGPDHAYTLETVRSLGRIYQVLGRLPEAIKLFEQVRDSASKKFGPESGYTLSAMEDIAGAYRIAGRLNEAKDLFQKVLDAREKRQGQGHSDHDHTLNGLAGVLQDLRQYSQAIEIYRKLVASRTQKHGSENPFTLLAQNDLGAALRSAGKLDESAKALESVATLRTNVLGPNHPETLVTLNNLAATYVSAKRFEDGIRLYQQLVARFTQKLGHDHPHTLGTRANLAVALRDSGKINDSLRLLEEIRTSMTNNPKIPSVQLCRVLDAMVELYVQKSQWREAINAFEQIRDEKIKEHGTTHDESIAAIGHLGILYRLAGRVPEAIPHLEQASTLIEQQKYRHPETTRVLNTTVQCYQTTMQYQQAEKWQRKLVAFVKGTSGDNSPGYAAELAILGKLLLINQNWTDAESVLRDCLRIREKAQPGGFVTFNTQSMLGDCLLGQKKYAEAEPLLLSGFNGMKAQEKTVPPVARIRIEEALERLIKHYEAINQSEKADDYKKQLAEMRKPTKQ